MPHDEVVHLHNTMVNISLLWAISSSDPAEKILTCTV